MTYYVHHTGKVGVSLDDGHSIYLPNGRHVERDPVWVGAGEDLYKSLSPEQRLVVDPVLQEELRREAAAQGLSALADKVNKRRKRGRYLSMQWWVHRPTPVQEAEGLRSGGGDAPTDD